MEFIQDKGIVRGRKRHACLGCTRVMAIGYPWHLCVMADDGSVYSVRTCWTCNAVAGLVRVSEWSEGELSEYDEWSPLRDIIEKEGIMFAFNQIKKEN